MSARLALAGAVLLVPSIAAADVPERHTGLTLELWGGRAGFSYFEAEGSGVDRATTRAGPTVGGALGWSFESGWRVAIEGSYSRNGFDEGSIHTKHGRFDLGGHIEVYRAMAVGAYDYGHQREWPVDLYVEGGAGAQAGRVNMGIPMSVNGERKSWVIENGRGWTNVVPAWLVGVGLNVPLTESLTAITGVRYTAGIGCNKINGGDGSSGDGWGGGSSWEIEETSIRVGLRWGF